MSESRRSEFASLEPHRKGLSNEVQLLIEPQRVFPPLSRKHVTKLKTAKSCTPNIKFALEKKRKELACSPYQTDTLEGKVRSLMIIFLNF